MAALVYVMGASGVGKDSLLGALREAAPGRLVAHRYITRSSSASENSIRLSPAEFARRKHAGLFCLDWQAHGLRYGLGIEIEQWLARGHIVIANGSRAHLSAAYKRFGMQLKPLLITADEHIVRDRLTRRGRESNAEIEARIKRHRDTEAALASHIESGAITRLDNSGKLTDGVTALARWLDSLAGANDIDAATCSDPAPSPLTHHYRPEACS